jgi:cytochrome oxidase Cu insertion factor (SCO1/SenC/PrrC family)
LVPPEHYSDLLADKSVVIDMMFTSCTGVCPVMSRT